MEQTELDAIKTTLLTPNTFDGVAQGVRKLVEILGGSVNTTNGTTTISLTDYPKARDLFFDEPPIEIALNKFLKTGYWKGFVSGVENYVPENKTDHNKLKISNGMAEILGYLTAVTMMHAITTRVHQPQEYINPHY